MAFYRFDQTVKNLASSNIQLREEFGNKEQFLNRLPRYDREYSTILRVFDKQGKKK